MGGVPAPRPPRSADERTITEVVPTRAVLTELARGFLLAHESSPDRARMFARTFLQEREGALAEPRAEPVRKVTLARLALGRTPHGAVEPP